MLANAEAAKLQAHEESLAREANKKDHHAQKNVQEDDQTDPKDDQQTGKRNLKKKAGGAQAQGQSQHDKAGTQPSQPQAAGFDLGARVLKQAQAQGKLEPPFEEKDVVSQVSRLPPMQVQVAKEVTDQTQ